MSQLALDLPAAEEVWKTIPGYSRYSASDRGRVRRDVTVYRTPPGLCSISSNDGYPQAAVTSDSGVSRTIAVHQLVLLAFVGPRPKGLHVCHGDGDRANSSLANLRYDTPKANVHDAIRHGTQVKGERVVQHILKEAEVAEIVSALEVGATYIALAEKYGVTNHCIFRIAAGKTWRHITGGKDRRNGYKFTHIGARAAKAKRQQQRAGLIDVVMAGGEPLVAGGCRVWRSV